MSEVVFIGVFEQVVEIALESVNLAKMADDYIHKTIINDDDSDDEQSE